MLNKKIKPPRDPASKSGIKSPKAYQSYTIALIIIIIIVFYSIMYW